jgi:hypothetical protein
MMVTFKRKWKTMRYDIPERRRKFLEIQNLYIRELGETHWNNEDVLVDLLSYTFFLFGFVCGCERTLLRGRLTSLFEHTITFVDTTRMKCQRSPHPPLPPRYEDAGGEEAG